MLTKISNARGGQVVFTYSNGVVVSMLWAWGSYSDNSIHNLGSEGWDDDSKRVNWESTTVEVYSMGNRPEFTRWISKQYGDNPAGYVPVDQIPRILKKAESLKEEL